MLQVVEVVSNIKELVKGLPRSSSSVIQRAKYAVLTNSYHKLVLMSKQDHAYFCQQILV